MKAFKLFFITVFFLAVAAFTQRGTGTDPYDAISDFNHDYVYFYVDVLDAGSDTTTKKVTFTVLRDSIKAYADQTGVIPDSVYITYNLSTKLTLVDSSIGEVKFTAAFNARLDSMLTLATTEIDTPNFVPARREEWRGFTNLATSLIVSDSLDTTKIHTKNNQMLFSGIETDSVGGSLNFITGKGTTEHGDITFTVLGNENNEGTATAYQIDTTYAQMFPDYGNGHVVGDTLSDAYTGGSGVIIVTSVDGLGAITDFSVVNYDTATTVGIYKYFENKVRGKYTRLIVANVDAEITNEKHRKLTINRMGVGFGHKPLGFARHVMFDSLTEIIQQGIDEWGPVSFTNSENLRVSSKLNTISDGTRGYENIYSKVVLDSKSKDVPFIIGIKSDVELQHSEIGQSTNSVDGGIFTVSNYRDLENLKAAWFNFLNFGDVSGIGYAFQSDISNRAFNDTTMTGHIASSKVGRFRIDNKAGIYTSYPDSIAPTATIDAAYGMYMNLGNSTYNQGGKYAALQPTAHVGSYYATVYDVYNEDANSSIDNIYQLDIWPLKNYGTIKNYYGIRAQAFNSATYNSPTDSYYGFYMGDQTASATNNWAMYIEGPKSYIEDLRTDVLTVADSTITESDVISWDAAADSMDQDLRKSASPTFSGLTMDGNVNLNGNYLSGDGDDEGISVATNGKVTFGVSGNTSNIYGSEFSKYNSGKIAVYDNITSDSHGDGSLWKVYRYGASYGKAPNSPLLFESAFYAQQTAGMTVFADVSYKANGDVNNGNSYILYKLRGDDVLNNALYFSGTYNKSYLNFVIGDVPSDSGRVVIADDSPWALVLGEKTGSPWSAIHVGDASFTTNSNGNDKNILEDKSPKGGAEADSLFDKILTVKEKVYKWKPTSVRRKFKEKYLADLDSLTITQKDSARIAWYVREEQRVERIVSRRRFGPIAQDVVKAFGPDAGDEDSINWDKVNSEYRRAVQELILRMRDHERRIAALEAEIAKLQKK